MKLTRAIAEQPEEIWYPQTGPQSLAYMSEADELYFGGSAGGGKSDLIIGVALTAHINSLFLRTESAQLTSTTQRIKEIMRAKDHWRGNGPYGGILTTGDGRTLELNGCATFGDANAKYRGRAHDLKAFDELPLFPREVYEFIIGWNRTTTPGQRCRVIGAGNPPATAEEEWVLDRWAPWLVKHTHEPGELAWFVKIDNEDKMVPDATPIKWKKELLFPKSRTFIPARLEDNPLLEATGYRQTLQMMPEPYRSQLLYGDMEIGRTDAEHQLIPTEWIDAAVERWHRTPAPDPQTVFLTAMGIDPSRGGKDRSVIMKRYDNWVAHPIIIPGKEAKDGPTLAAKVLMHVDYLNAPLIIDITGTAGGGLYDSMRLMAVESRAWPFVASNASEYRDKSGRIKMRNKRTEAYWRLRDALDPSGLNPLCLPPNKDLRVELAAQRWYMYSAGAGIEDKDEINKRLGRSCDLSDALAYTMQVADANNGWLSPPPVPAAIPDKFMGGRTSPRPGANHPWRS